MLSIFIKENLEPKINYCLYFENNFMNVNNAKFFRCSELSIVNTSKKLSHVSAEEEIKEIINNYHTEKNER